MSKRKSGSGNEQQCSLYDRPHYTQIDWDCVSSLNNTVHDATTSIEQDFNGRFAHGVCICVLNSTDLRKLAKGVNKKKTEQSLEKNLKFSSPIQSYEKKTCIDNLSVVGMQKTTAIAFHSIP